MTSPVLVALRHTAIGQQAEEIVKTVKLQSGEVIYVFKFSELRGLMNFTETDELINVLAGLHANAEPDEIPNMIEVVIANQLGVLTYAGITDETVVTLGQLLEWVSFLLAKRLE